MSDERIDPVDAALGALFHAERGAKAPLGAKERSWAKLEAAVGMPTTAAPAKAVGPASAGMLKLLGALAVGAVLGGGAVATLRAPTVVYVDRPVPAASSAEPAPAVVGMPTVIRAPAPADPAPSVAAPTPVPSSSNLAAERAVLDEARTALGRGNGQHALEATARHQREFPRGQLAEEREAIAVQALTNLQRCDEATARGNRFKQRYSNSVLGPVVDAALSVCATRQ